MMPVFVSTVAGGSRGKQKRSPKILGKEENIGNLGDLWSRGERASWNSRVISKKFPKRYGGLQGFHLIKKLLGCLSQFFKEVERILGDSRNVLRKFVGFNAFSVVFQEVPWGLKKDTSPF